MTYMKANLIDLSDVYVAYISNINQLKYIHLWVEVHRLNPLSACQLGTINKYLILNFNNKSKMYTFSDLLRYIFANLYSHWCGKFTYRHFSWIGIPRPWCQDIIWYSQLSCLRCHKPVAIARMQVYSAIVGLSPPHACVRTQWTPSSTLSSPPGRSWTRSWTMSTQTRAPPSGSILSFLGQEYSLSECVPLSSQLKADKWP